MRLGRIQVFHQDAAFLKQRSSHLACQCFFLVLEEPVVLPEGKFTGFVLAEKDLELRGAGQLFGMKQHGLPDLLIADILHDMDVLLEARVLAKKTIEEPTMLSDVEIVLKNQFDTRFQHIFNL